MGAGTVTLVLAGLSLLGYARDWPLAAQLLPGSAAMKPTTAVALLVAALSLWLVAPASASRLRRRSGQSLSLAVTVFGAAVAAEYLTGRDLGLDTLFFADRVRGWSTVDIPGRPPPHAALALIVTGLALALLDVDARGGYRPARVLVPAGALVAGAAMLDHAYGLTYLSGTSTVNSMPYGTAAALVALSLGLLACRPERTAALVFLGADPDGVPVRRLASVMFGMMLLFGILLAIGRRNLPAAGPTVTVATAVLTLTLYVVFLRAGTALIEGRRALRDQRDFYQTVLHSLREGVLTADAHGTVQTVTPRWCEITGYPVEDAVGARPPYPWWPPAPAATLLAHCVAALSAGGPTECDLVLRRKDGTDVAVLVTAAPVRDGAGRRVLVCTYRDLTHRDWAEAERRRTAAQLDHFFAVSTDLLCLIGTDGYFKRANSVWEHALGYPVEEMLSRPYLEFIHPDDVAATMLAAEQLAKGNPILTFENRYRCRDGSYRWLNWNAIPGPAAGLICAAAKDCTDQHHADETRAWLAAIVNGTEDAIIGGTLDGTITSWNPAATRQCGYQAEEMIGQSVRLLAPPDRAEEVTAILAQLRAGEPVKLHNTVRIRKDGTRFNVALSISPIRDSAGTLIGAASIARDITHRIKAEEQFQRLVLTAPDAMLIVNEQGTIVLVNEQTERMFGYASADLTGQPIEILLPSPLQDRHARHRQDYAAAPRVRRMGDSLDLFAVRRDGSRFPVEISLAPLDTDQGTLTSAAIRDITERRAVEQSLANARDEALTAAQLKSQFVAMVSHEIRTPMNGVIGLTELLLATSLHPSQRRYATAIRTSGRALLLIINDILDFSKIEAGKIELVDVDYELDHLLDETIQVAAETARDKELEILVYYPPQLPTSVRGDSGRLRQALLNLLGNAVKFSEQGEIVLRAEPAAPAPDGRPQVTFSVTDTGIGIAAKDLSRLFEAFSQVDAATNREFGGTGLGLTIARQLIALLGGHLEVESQPGRGSRFWFTIPIVPRPGTAGRSKDRMAGHRVLIVDANPLSRDLITHHCRAWGMIPAEAPDGFSAMDRLRSAADHGEPFDVAVIDQRLPTLTGVELIHQITADPTIPRLRSVLLTSGTRDDDQIDAMTVLPKPIGPSQLYDCLLGLLDADLVEQSGPARTPGASSKGLILVAEDNPINQMVAVDTLTMLGYQVDVARNGLEALERAAAKPYQAILMDCQMPKMDGYAATIELRNRENDAHHLPIIAMTAGVLAEDKQRCLDAGMDDFLGKPIHPDQLQAALDRWTTETTPPR